MLPSVGDRLEALPPPAHCPAQVGAGGALQPSAGLCRQCAGHLAPEEGAAWGPTITPSLSQAGSLEMFKLFCPLKGVCGFLLGTLAVLSLLY